MPEGAWSITVRSFQLFPTEKSEVKIQCQFTSLLYTSLPYPGNAPQPQAFPNSCSGPCLYQLSKFPLPEWGHNQGKINDEEQSRMVVSTSGALVKFFPIPKWLGTLINNQSFCQLWVLRQNSFQAPCLNVNLLTSFDTYVGINTNPVTRGKQY